MLMFLHLPKTGGTTLSAILRDLYSGRPYLDHESLDNRPATLHDLTKEQRASLVLAMGHYRWGLHQTLGCAPHYITLLRDPVERVLSTYSFLVLQGYPGYEALAGTSLEAFLDLSHEARNLQMRMLSGAGDEEDGDPEQAAANLKSCLAVGTTERFNDSLRLFRRRLGWPETAYPHKNVTRKRLLRRDVTPAVLRKIERLNAHDQELWLLSGRLLQQGLNELENAPSAPE